MKLFDEFLWFVRERATIAVKKKLGEPEPWTADKHLRAGKFGNVWRELDRGTLWERQAIKGLRVDQACRLIMVYRHCLVPTTTEVLLLGATPDELLQALDGRPVVHDVVKEWPGIDARAYEDATREQWAEYACQHRDVVDKLEWWPETRDTVFAEEPDADSLWYHLQEVVPTLGPFKAYEVVTSLAYLPWGRITGDSLVHVGHGAEPTLKLLTGASTPGDLLVVRDALNRALDEDPTFVAAAITLGMPARLTARATEDCLCEWRKWRGARDGSRPVRSRDDLSRRWS